MARVCSSQPPIAIGSTTTDNHSPSSQCVSRVPFHASRSYEPTAGPEQAIQHESNQQMLAIKNPLQANTLHSLLPDSVLLPTDIPDANGTASSSSSVATKTLSPHAGTAIPTSTTTTSTSALSASTTSPETAAVSNQNQESSSVSVQSIEYSTRPIMKAATAETSESHIPSPALRRQRSASDSSCPSLLSDSSLLRLAEEAGFLLADEHKPNQATGVPDASSTAAPAQPIACVAQPTADDIQLTALSDNKSSSRAGSNITSTNPMTNSTSQVLRQKTAPKPASIPAFFPAVKGSSTASSGLTAVKRFPPLKSKQVIVPSEARTPQKQEPESISPDVLTARSKEEEDRRSASSDGVFAHHISRSANTVNSNRRDRDVCDSPTVGIGSLDTPPQTQREQRDATDANRLSNAGPRRQLQLNSTPLSATPVIPRPKLDITFNLSSSDDDEPDNNRSPTTRGRAAARVLETPSPSSFQHDSKPPLSTLT